MWLLASGQPLHTFDPCYLPRAPGEMQWKVARSQGSRAQCSRKTASTDPPSAAGPAASTRKGCSASQYRRHSQSQSQGAAAAGAVNRSSSDASSEARPPPSAAPPHLHNFETVAVGIRADGLQAHCTQYGVECEQATKRPYSKTYAHQHSHQSSLAHVHVIQAGSKQLTSCIAGMPRMLHIWACRRAAHSRRMFCRQAPTSCSTASAVGPCAGTGITATQALPAPGGAPA